jgi:hypothetical protein
LTTALKVDNNALISGKRGTVFVAPAGTPLPTDLTKLLISADAPDPAWQNLGHTSESNLPSWDKSGGDASTLNTWLMSGAKTTYAPTSISVKVKALQANAETLKFVYNGWDDASGGVAVALDPASQPVALIVLSYDPDSRKPFGTYMSDTSMKSDGMPDFSGDFVEFGFTASVESSSVISPSSDGTKAALVFLPPSAFTAKPDGGH